MSRNNSAVVITGGGIGIVTVRLLSERGYHVFAGPLSPAAGAPLRW